MKTTTPALLALILAASGLLLSISAQDTNLTTVEVPTLVFLNQTLPINSSIDVITVNASSGSETVPSAAEVSVIAVASSGEGLVNATGGIEDLPVASVDPILEAINASTPITSGNMTVSTNENILLGPPDVSTEISNFPSIPVDNQTTSSQPLPISPDASGSITSTPTQPSVSNDSLSSLTGNSTSNIASQTSDSGSNSSNVEQPSAVQVNSTDASVNVNVSSNSSSDNINQSTDLFNNATVNTSSDNNQTMAVNSTTDAVIPIMNVTTLDNSSNSRNNTTTPAVVANFTANLTTPNTTNLVINSTIVKNSSSTNKTVEDEVSDGRENKVKGAIIGSVLGFIGLIVCVCVFSARLRRWCRNVITGHETEEDQDISNVKTIDERQIEEQIEKNSTITVRTKLRVNQLLGCSFFNTGNGTIPTQPKQEKDNSGPDEENGIENDSNSNSMNQELPKQSKKGDKALSDQHKKTQRESHQHILESESDSQNSMDQLKGDEGSSVMRIETQIHKMETRHEILTEKKTHQKDSEEYESEDLSKSEKSFENNNNNINEEEEDMRDQPIFEDNEAQEVAVQRPKKPTTQ